MKVVIFALHTLEGVSNTTTISIGEWIHQQSPKLTILAVKKEDRTNAGVDLTICTDEIPNFRNAEPGSVQLMAGFHPTSDVVELQSNCTQKFRRKNVSCLEYTANYLDHIDGDCEFVNMYPSRDFIRWDTNLNGVIVQVHNNSRHGEPCGVNGHDFCHRLFEWSGRFMLKYDRRNDAKSVPFTFTEKEYGHDVAREAGGFSTELKFYYSHQYSDETGGMDAFSEGQFLFVRHFILGAVKDHLTVFPTELYLSSTPDIGPDAVFHTNLTPSIQNARQFVGEGRFSFKVVRCPNPCYVHAVSVVDSTDVDRRLGRQLRAPAQQERRAQQQRSVATHKIRIVPAENVTVSFTVKNVDYHKVSAEARADLQKKIIEKFAQDAKVDESNLHATLEAGSIIARVNIAGSRDTEHHLRMHSDTDLTALVKSIDLGSALLPGKTIDDVGVSEPIIASSVSVSVSVRKSGPDPLTIVASVLAVVWLSQAIVV